MRQTGYSIDWTASLELEENKKQDPWIILNKMRPDKDRPSTRLANYAGTKYDIFTLYLSRKGIDLGTRVNAYASGHSKVIECQGVLYLTTIDGTVYERNKPEGFNIKKELRKTSNA